MQKEEKTRLNPLLESATRQCKAAKATYESYVGQIETINKKAGELELKKGKIVDKETALKNANCKDSIFLQERFKEFKAEKRVLDNEITFLKAPLKEDSATNSLSVNYGLENLRDEAKTAQKIPCDQQKEYEEEIAELVDKVKAFKQEVPTRVCTGWCAINWASYSPDLSKHKKCINNFTELEKEVDKVLADPYNQSVQNNFADCVGFTIPFQNFGADWESKDDGF